MDTLTNHLQSQFSYPPRSQHQGDGNGSKMEAAVSHSVSGIPSDENEIEKMALVREKYSFLCDSSTTALPTSVAPVRSVSPSCSESEVSSTSTVVEIDVISNTRKFKLQPMPLPFWADFDAKILGITVEGKVVLQVENDKISDEYRSLRSKMRKFYMSNKIKNERPITAASLEPGVLVCFERTGVMVRGKIVYVDRELNFCTLIDVDKYQPHAVEFTKLFELDKQFNIPAKAVECILDGFELNAITTKSVAAIQSVLKTLDPKVKGTVIRKAKEYGSLPVVSISTSSGEHVVTIINEKLKSASNLHASSIKQGTNVKNNFGANVSNPSFATHHNITAVAKELKPRRLEAAGKDFKSVGIDPENQKPDPELRALPKRMDATSKSAPETVATSSSYHHKTDFGSRTKENQINSSDSRSISSSNDYYNEDTNSRHSRNDHHRLDRSSNSHNRNGSLNSTTPPWWKSENRSPRETDFKFTASKSQSRQTLEWEDFVAGIMLKMKQFSPPASPKIPFVTSKGNRVKSRFISEMETEYLLCPYFPDRLIVPDRNQTVATASATDNSKKQPSTAPLKMCLWEPEKTVQKSKRSLAPADLPSTRSGIEKAEARPTDKPAPAEAFLTPADIATSLKGPGGKCSSSSNLKNMATAAPLEIKIAQLSSTSTTPTSPSNSNLFPLPYTRNASGSDSASVEMSLPPGYEFTAKLLGTDAYGYFIIQICEPVLNAEFTILYESLQDLYSSRQIRALNRLSPTELKNGMLVVAHIDNSFIRCKVYDVDISRGVSILVGLEEHEFHDVELKDIYRINEIFKALPQRAVKCMLSGLELHMLTEEIPNAFAITPLGSLEVRVTVLSGRDNLFLVPGVTMTLANGADLAELIKKNGSSILKRVQTVEEIQERLALQMQLRYTLLHNKYLTGSG